MINESKCSKHNQSGTMIQSSACVFSFLFLNVEGACGLFNDMSMTPTYRYDSKHTDCNTSFMQHNVFGWCAHQDTAKFSLGMQDKPCFITESTFLVKPRFCIFSHPSTFSFPSFITRSLFLVAGAFQAFLVFVYTSNQVYGQRRDGYGDGY